jgi:hypothetical protein
MANQAMHYFVLFSVLLIAASVVVLLLPSNHPEGFAPRRHASTAQPSQPAQPTQPVAAGQRNTSGNAGSADGTSDHDHLLNALLKKHDKLAEAFENRKKTNRDGVSATTTKKKGIASTSAPTDEGDNVSIPSAGCNKNCRIIKDPMDAIDGNCVNPTLPNGEPDYSMKYCTAFTDNDFAQECLTCGYYGYTANCLKNADPKDPSKCTQYGDYSFQQPTGTNKKYIECDADNAVCKLLAQQAGGGQGQGSSGPSGPSCSTCKLDINPMNKCVLPGCYSADDGYLPFPDDDGYNFAEGCFYYNPSNGQPPLPGMQGRAPGYYCPPVTQGQSYDGGGSSGDPCYTNNGSLSYAKYVMMDKVCSNDKQPSAQKFVPGKDAPIDGNGTKHRSASKTGATTNHQHQHRGAINVYHHHMNSSGSKNMNGSKNTNDSKNMNMNDSKNTNDSKKNQGYMEPEAGAGVLGFL